MRYHLNKRLEGESQSQRILLTTLSGNFGVVYKASWRKAECVVKQIKLKDLKSSIDFEKEAHAMGYSIGLNSLSFFEGPSSLTQTW